MLLLVTFTGVTGFLTSVALRLHLTVMSLRYGLSVTAAYIVFLALFGWWTRIRRRRRLRSAAVPVRGSGDGSGWIDWIPVDFDVDGLLAVFMVATALLFIIAIYSTISLIVGAPQLLSELILDGAVSAALYRRLSSADQREWFASVFQRTRRPFFAFLAFFICLGIVCRTYAPEAISIGGVIREIVAN